MPDTPPETERAAANGAAPVKQTPAKKAPASGAGAKKAPAKAAPAKAAPGKAGGKAARRQGKNASRAEALRLRREREEAEKEQRARERRRRRLIFLVIALVVAGGIIAFDWYALHNSKKKPAASARPSTSPLWPAPTDPSARVAAAGLKLLDAEGTALHIHVHLDVIVSGKPITVPADLGIDLTARKISPLHTHDTTGVVHIESPTQAEFNLGEFFTEWAVPLAADHVGDYTVSGTDQLKVYVNGKVADGDPAKLILHAHDEIAVIYGTVAQQQNPPSSYTFPDGL